LSVYILLFAVALIAFCISTVAGGGAGLVLLPLLGLVLPATQIPAALSLGTMTNSVSRLILFRQAIRWDFARSFVPPALLCAIPGTWLLTRISPVYLELLLGFFLVSNILFLLRPPASGSEVQHPPSRAMLALIGALAGFISGFTGAVGLVFNGFYLHAGLRKEEIVATRAANEVLLHAMKLALYLGFGLLTKEALCAGLLVALAALLASHIMRHLLPFISESFFRRLGYGAMCLAGVAMVLGSSNQLAVEKGIRFAHENDNGRPEFSVYSPNHAYSVAINHIYDAAFERSIPLSSLPQPLQTAVFALAQDAAAIIVEEVFGFSSHGYEVKIRDGADQSVRIYTVNMR